MKNQALETNSYYQFWLRDFMQNSTRDVVYAEALKLCPKKCKILEIGAARDLQLSTRRSDGWSTIFWANANPENIIEVCDISLEAIENAENLTRGFDNVKFSLMDGSLFLKKHSDYDLVYLDGSDDPEQMVEQFYLCRQDKPVLCDDFHVKGKLLRHKEPNFVLYQWNNGHEMALYVPNGNRKKINPDKDL